MLLSQEELDRSAEADPQVVQFYKDFPPPPASVGESVEVRAGLVRAGVARLSEVVLKRLGPAPVEVKEFYHDIPMRDGFSSSLKVFKPTEHRPAGPLVVLCFGGGFVAGDKDQLTETARTLVKLFSATVVNISYRLAPEHKFPYAQHDAMDSLEWVAKNATGSLLNADPAQGFLLGGVSAGGALAAALSRYYQQTKLAYSLTGQWLCVPSIMSQATVPEKYKSYWISYHQNSGGSSLSKDSLAMMRSATQWDESSELRYAINSHSSLSDQPRTYFQIDGMDPLRDDGLIYDEMLKEAGVPTKVDFYPGCPHAHMFSMRDLEIGRRAKVDEIVGFGWLLDKTVSRDAAAKALGQDL